MNDFFTKFFDTSDFPARWNCGNWSDFLGWLHVLSDVAIFAAYFAIPAVLIFFVRKRDDFPFSNLFWLFGGFILACGTTHLIEAIIFWNPIYRVAGAMKLFTAVISWATVIVLVRYTPQILHLPSLAATNERLRESEAAALAASQSKSEFLANMSHEIRTPMAAILGYADVLLGHLKDPDNRNCVMIMKRNGEHLLGLINDILDLSRIEAGKLDIDLQQCKLPQLVADIQSLMQVRATEKKLAFHVEFEGLVPQTIQTDPTRLRQVLINLIGNAIKFTAEGEVRLRVKLVGSADPPVVEFAIIDTGIGITAEQQGRLFKPFSQADTSVTRKYGGSGLGLAISQRLVKMLLGEIELESEYGQGSTFLVRIPVGSLDQIELIEPNLVITKTEPEQSPSESPNLDCRILVVDDRRDVRHISQHFLEKAGAKVSTAEDGQQGIDAAITGRDRGEPFDLVVMDMQMPNVDGLQAVAAMRSAGIEWPIIALTADAMKGDRDKCLNGGCDDYLSKPIDQAELIRMAAKYTQTIPLDELRRARAERIQALRTTLSDLTIEDKATPQDRP
jgi:signal transduction histidine kinase/CheY-like chemotaxis protein